eukprot:CAMPEP_0204538964 /NCGR_PEP_ID=MMETSP0661-20131031/16379_1 /ASSEMBLY_ACC=CAM_ASM_000606 /TAXON_ID=109239 /ORGANISM="Alexandrium margalefi, Strain AMGDE01CS-322" /LENGTH=614 /DNA_ID=CAMNT_0051545563 /DNA_START=3 /DNA_END=1847 /DNA_ORIENTATION=+
MADPRARRPVATVSEDQPFIRGVTPILDFETEPLSEPVLKVKRSQSFAAYGSLVQTPVQRTLARGRSCGASLSLMDAIHPATPLRRGSTTDELSGLASHFSALSSAVPETGEGADLGPEPSMEPLNDSFFDFDDLPPVVRGLSPTKLARPVGTEGTSNGPHPERAGGASPALASSPSASGGAQKRRSSAPPGTRSDGLRIAILANGSDGDLIPLLALGENLRDQHHHALRAFTNANLIGLCLDRGIDAVPVFADTRAVFESLGGVSGTIADVTRRGLVASLAWLKANPGVCTAAEDALSEFQPHALICGAGASGPGMHHEHDSCVPTIPVWLQRATLDIFEDHLHVEPTRPQFLAASSAMDDVPLPKAHRLHRTSAWVLPPEPSPESPEGRAQLAALRRFLAAGPAPVAVGWGSMLVEGLTPGAMLDLAVGALRLAGRRGVVLGGWARLHELGRELAWRADEGGLQAFVVEQVCFVPFAPHDWLFPQCSCVVHHGGSGTAHAALRAGTPAVVTPVFADQFDTSKAINRLGSGYGFDEALSQITPDKLHRALRLAEDCGPQCRELARQLEQEKGVKHAGAIVDSFLRQEVKTGRWSRKAQKLREQEPGGSKSRRW